MSVKENMDIVKIASRIASSRVFQFKGMVYNAFEGETSGGDGTLTFDGKAHKVEFFTDQRDMELKIDGVRVDPEQNTELYNEVENFLSLNFPDLEDERWEEDPDAQDPDDEDEDGGSDAMKMDVSFEGPGFP